MSHLQSLGHENFNLPNPEIGMDSLLPHCSIITPLICAILPRCRTVPTPVGAESSAPGVLNFADGSGHIFSMYLEMAIEEDKKMVESWKADADGILISVRLHPPILCFTLTQWS